MRILNIMNTRNNDTVKYIDESDKVKAELEMADLNRYLAKYKNLLRLLNNEYHTFDNIEIKLAHQVKIKQYESFIKTYKREIKKLQMLINL